jgi:hypothetical protein
MAGMDEDLSAELLQRAGRDQCQFPKSSARMAEAVCTVSPRSLDLHRGGTHAKSRRLAATDLTSQAVANRIEGSERLRRPIYMRLSNAQHQDWAELGAGLLAHAISWPVACAMVTVLLISLGYRVVAERSRRRTLIEVCAYAPSGTVIVLEAGPGGPAMRLWIGDRQRPGLTGASLVLPAGRGSRPLAGGGDGRQA